MRENDQSGLRRLDVERMLPTGFRDMSEQQQHEVLKRLQDQDIEIRGEMLRKVGKSEIAEHDLTVGIEAVQRLDHERKIYSKRMKGETGSGTYDLQIRGGDTKFVVPVLVVLGIIVLGVLLIMSL